MISLIHLYLRKDWPTIVTYVGILLVITLALSLVQMMGTQVITVNIFGVGTLLGLIIPLAVMRRGKHGEGKCLSRLPMARYRIFLVQFIYGIMAALAFMFLLRIGIEAIRGIVALSGYGVSPSVLLSGSDWMGDIRSFSRAYPVFVFLVAFVRWLEKWMNRDQALALAVLIPLIILFLMIIVPAVAQIHTAAEGPGIVSYLMDWAIRYRQVILVTIYVLLLGGSLVMYRVRHFKSF